MFMKTNSFCFVDILNYFGPGTSHDKWVKGLGVSRQGSMAVLTGQKTENFV